VAAQVFDPLRPLPPAQIIGAADNHKLERRGQPHRDHVGCDQLTQADTGVESFRGKIDQLLACADLHLDLGIVSAERGDHWFEDQWDDRSGNGEAQQSGRPLSQPTRGLACGDDLLECGLRPRQEFFAGLGQADAARRAYEERCAEAHLKRSHRLAHCRRRHPEFRGRFAKVAASGDAEESLHAVERALPDCEVLLHSPSFFVGNANGGRTHRAADLDRSYAKVSPDSITASRLITDGTPPANHRFPLLASRHPIQDVDISASRLASTTVGMSVDSWPTLGIPLEDEFSRR
jgi:hypothetical protein